MKQLSKPNKQVQTELKSNYSFVRYLLYMYNILLALLVHVGCPFIIILCILTDRTKLANSTSRLTGLSVIQSRDLSILKC